MSRDTDNSRDRVTVSQPTTEDNQAQQSTDTPPAKGGRFAFLDPRNFPLRHKLGVLGLVGLAILPVFIGPLSALTMTSAMFFAMFTMSWDAVSGYTGQISFGHGVFFTIGAYTTTLLNLGFDVSPLLSIPAGIVLAAVAGILIGVPALRLRGPYLSLVTLIAPLILLQIFIFKSGIFGGELGLSSPPSLLGFSPYANYYLAFGLFLFILAVLLAVTRSNAGAVFTAIREDEDAVSAAGLNPAKFKIFAFVLSAAIGGLAGAMFVHTPQGSPRPSVLLTLVVNIEVIIAAILGGMGTIVGAAIGGIFFYLLREWLSGVGWVVPVIGTPVSEIDFLVFSVITLLLLFFLPGGFLRAGLRSGQRVIDRLGMDNDQTPATDGGQTPLEQTIEKYREAYRDWFGGDRP
jgi:branched-chain amino acid transport system permease protein